MTGSPAPTDVVASATALVIAGGRQGTGVRVDRQHLLTARHVVVDKTGNVQSPIKVYFLAPASGGESSPKPYDGQVMGLDARMDIAVIELTPLAGLPPEPTVAGLYHVDRFRVFAHPGRDTRGAAYNVTQAHIAIANGGLFGRGLFQGPQTRGAFVPEQQTDFVYSVAGEEFGLVGAGLIILLFALLCWRGLRIAARADRTGRLIAVGVVCWFAFQAFQNIGMNLGLTPVTGLPLPFVSYGGSSMFAQSLAVGLLIAVGRYSAAQRSVV